jgi:hypothetical protein
MLHYAAGGWTRSSEERSIGAEQLLTAEDLGALPEAPGKRIESVKGEVVEVPAAGVLHIPIVAPLYRLLHIFIQGRNVGLVFTGGLGAIVGRRPDRAQPRCPFRRRGPYRR